MAKKQQQQQQRARRSLGHGEGIQKKDNQTHNLVMNNEEEEGPNQTLKLSATTDIVAALMNRYGASSAPQHRHLIASAAAMKSILVDENIPLSPSAYLAAAITALQNSSDADSTAAVAAFLAILIPNIREQDLSPSKAREASAVLASVLKTLPEKTATGTVRSMVKSLGSIAVFVNLDDWNSVQMPFETLLTFTLDSRPKVRRCAQGCIVEICSILPNHSIIKKASKVILVMFENYIPVAEKLKSVEVSDASFGKMLSKSENVEVIHMLTLLKFLAPKLPEKVCTIVLSHSCKLLGHCFSMLTRQVIGLLEALVESSCIEVLLSESESILHALTTYLSGDEKHPVDTIISASSLLKTCLDKFSTSQPTIWIKYFPTIFSSLAGCLSGDIHIAQSVGNILRDLIIAHIDQKNFDAELTNHKKENPADIIALKSIYSAFEKMLNSCDVPSEPMLKVISVLFLKLGPISYIFMKEIVLKLSQWAMQDSVELSNRKHIEEALGAAVIAVGPEKMLSITPLTCTKENITCSNTWLIPILKKYIVGVPLRDFMDYILPVANIIKACDRAKKSRRGFPKSYFYPLWDLLPSFCRYTTYTSKDFDSFADILIVTLKENPSLHETIAVALQELVNGNKRILGNDDKNIKDIIVLESGMLKDLGNEPLTRFPLYSKEIATGNIKILASRSMDILRVLADLFFDSPPEKRNILKETIRCLSSIIESENLKNFFASMLGRFEEAVLAKPVNGDETQSQNKKEDSGELFKQPFEGTRCLTLELASAFIEAADKDLVNLIFDYIRSALMVTDPTCRHESYDALSCILKEHSWFCAGHIDEIMDLLLGTGLTDDSASCYRHFLVHVLKCNEDSMNSRAFLILNQIILTLKTKKESRKIAYDMLLHVVHDLKDSQSTHEGSDLQRLFSMVMGYLSSPSPHIKSGAIAALSLLIYSDAAFCLSVPNLIQSVVMLLQDKANEVIKAALGFVKVLADSLNSDYLSRLLPDIVNGILPWSSISKHHFRSKVGIILEILIRKCGFDVLDTMVPGKYKGFVKSVVETRHSKKSSNGSGDRHAKDKPSESIPKRGKRRIAEDGLNLRTSNNSSDFQSDKRWKSKNKVAKTTRANGTANKVSEKETTSEGDPSKNKTERQGRARSSHNKHKRKDKDMKQHDGSILKTKRHKAAPNFKYNGSVSKAGAPSKFRKPKKSVTPNLT